VFSFKAPSAEELDHTYLWRSMKALPERGRIGIHNRSYYEEVLVVRVHPEFLASQRLPDAVVRGRNIWKDRFRQINDFERYLAENGTVVIKFFMHVSKAEQRRRFLERLDDPGKNWKFSLGDVRERGLWDAYQQAYQDALRHTSTAHAPWYVIPSDHKWFARLAVSTIINRRLEALGLSYPTVSKTQRAELKRARAALVRER
jgi:PPK2 family polyphosphate:nucleotide phosphotransferase